MGPTGLMLIACLLFAKDVLGSGQVKVTPSYLVVKEGDPVTLLCQVGAPIEHCAVKMPLGGKKIIFSPRRSAFNNMVYPPEASMQNGQCGFRVEKATPDLNGVFTCSLSPVDFYVETEGHMTLVIARAPQRPELNASQGLGDLKYYKEGEIFRATCTVRNGRPVANISWYLNDERITDGLSKPNITSLKDEDLHTVSQTLTRIIQATDNDKSFRCVASHILLTENNSSEPFKISVMFPPKPLQTPIEYFGLVEGEDGFVTVVVAANPKPTFVWSIGDEEVREGEIDSAGKFQVQRTVETKPGNWESQLKIHTLSKEDVEKSYVLTASNMLGNEKYTILISTSPEPKVVDIGAATIALVVIIILVVLLIASILLFARAKGRWCFAGKSASQNIGECSDTESAGEHYHSSKPKLLMPSVFKKKSDKVSADAPGTQSRDVTVNDEKVDGNDDEGNVKSKLRNEEGVVYAELDLQNSTPARGLLVRPENYKTEYAEIIHAKDK